MTKLPVAALSELGSWPFSHCASITADLQGAASLRMHTHNVISSLETMKMCQGDVVRDSAEPRCKDWRLQVNSAAPEATKCRKTWDCLSASIRVTSPTFLLFVVQKEPMAERLRFIRVYIIIIIIINVFLFFCPNIFKAS